LYYGFLIFLLIIDKSLAVLRLKKSFLSLGFIETLHSKQEYDGSKITKAIPFDYTPINETIKEISKTY